MRKRFTSISLVLFVELACMLVFFPMEAGDRESLAMREIRIEVEDFRRRLDQASSEFMILDSKLRNQGGELNKLQAAVKSERSSKSGELALKTSDLERRLAAVVAEQKEILKDLRRIAEHGNTVSTTLNQYAEKVTSLEREMSKRDKHLERQLSDLKKGMGSLIAFMDKGDTGTGASAYTVRSGDSLEKIARAHHTSIKAIKELNQLTSDLIIVGQKLMMP